MVTGIGLHLGAVQRHMAKAHHPRLLAQRQDLHEQDLEGIKVAAPKLTDPSVVRLLVAGQHEEGQVLAAGLFDLAGEDDAHAVGIEKEHRHHPCNKTLLASGILRLRTDQDLIKIQGIDQVQQETHLCDLLRATHAVREAGGWSAPAARGGRSCVHACPNLSPRFPAITWIWADLSAFLERLVVIYTRGATKPVGAERAHPANQSVAQRAQQAQGKRLSGPEQ
jgi:hypothetical protein